MVDKVLNQESESRIVDVLVIVDTFGALAAGTLSGYIYFVDSNRYFGSSGQGTASLYTRCNVGETIRWRAVSVNQGNPVEINGFVGQMINSENCVPEKHIDSITKETFWQGAVQAKSSERGRNINYTLSIKMNGRVMVYDPYIYVNP